jgi:hypothetical protein
VQLLTIDKTPDKSEIYIDHVYCQMGVSVCEFVAVHGKTGVKRTLYIKLLFKP